jgi:ABC-type phosphate transport system auxiliary subunit
MENNAVKNAPIKETPKGSESIPSLLKEIARLQKENVKMENKISAQNTTILTIRTKKAKLEHKIATLQFKYDELEKEKQPCFTFFIDSNSKHKDILQQIKDQVKDQMKHTTRR